MRTALRAILVHGGTPLQASKRWLTGWLAALLALTGCQTQMAVIKASRPSAVRAQAKGVSTQSLSGRVVENGVRMTLRGVVRLTTDFGVNLVSNNSGGIVSGETGRIISNNSGNLISNNGGGLVSNNSGGLVSNNSGGLVSNNVGGLTARPFRLLSEAVTPEDRLAEALVEAIDASGELLLDASKKPIQVQTSKTGEYTLSATVPKDNFILRVRLLAKLGGANGELRTMVVPGTEPREINAPIDTASSLATGYVLSEYVKGRQEVFNRLPADANAELLRDVNTARQLLKDKPNYDESGLRSVVANLRQSDATLDRTLEKVKALLLVGQENLGSGMSATRVPLTLPVDVVRDPAGNLLIAEQVGRIRKIGSDGIISTYAGEQWDKPVQEGVSANEVGFKNIHRLVIEPDGSLLFTERLGHRLIRITSDGRVKFAAGTGEPGQDTLPAPAKQTRLLHPEGLALSPDGDIYLTEKNRVLRLDRSGILHFVSNPFDGDKTGAKCLCFGADGALWAANGYSLWRRDPASLTWRRMAVDLDLGLGGYLQPDSQGGVYLSMAGQRKIMHVAPDAQTNVTLASIGLTGSGPTNLETLRGVVQPFGFWIGPDNKMLVCEAGGLIREFDLNDANTLPRTVAGTQSVFVTGSSQALGVNAPGGMASTPDGQGLLYTEVAGAVIKRFQDQTVSTILGNTLTVNANGAERTVTTVAPVAVDYDAQGNLWAFIGDDPQLVRIDPQGRATLMAGSGTSYRAVPFNVEGKSALDVPLGQPVALKLGPDGLPYWTDMVYHHVCRLNADGRLELIVGANGSLPNKPGNNGSNKPASEMQLNMPYGLGFDSKGDLYLSDAANMRVLKVSMQSPERLVNTLVGGSLFETLGSLQQDGAVQIPARIAAKDALIVVPGPMFIDARDRLFLGELGTVRLDLASSLAKFNFPIKLPLVSACVRMIDLKSNEPTLELLAGPNGKIFDERYGLNSLGAPGALLIDKQSRLVVADILNNQIKMAPLPAGF